MNQACHICHNDSSLEDLESSYILNHQHKVWDVISGKFVLNMSGIKVVRSIYYEVCGILKGSNCYHNLGLPCTSSLGHLLCMVLHHPDSTCHLLYHLGCSYQAMLVEGWCSMILSDKEWGESWGKQVLFIEGMVNG